MQKRKTVSVSPAHPSRVKSFTQTRQLPFHGFLAATTLCSGAFLFNPQVARAQTGNTPAGHWEAVPLDGTDGSAGYIADVLGRYPGTLKIGATDYSVLQGYQGQRSNSAQVSATGFGVYSERNDSSGITADFTGRTYFRWVPDVEGTTPPAFLNIRKELLAKAFITKRDTNPNIGSLSVSVSGSGVPATHGQLPIGQNPDEGITYNLSNTSDGLKREYMASRTLLMQVPTNGQEVVTVEGGSVNAQAQMTGGYAGVLAGIDFQLDNRSVKLTRNNKDRFEVGADGNWITYGDTTYSYNESTSADWWSSSAVSWE